MASERSVEKQERAAKTEAGISPEPGLWLRIENKLGWLEDLLVMPFRSHGAQGWLRVKGRVVEATSAEGSGDDEEESLLKNAWTSFRRMESDEIPGARIRAAYRGAEWESVSDDEGYFSFRLEPERELEPGWHDVPLTVDVPLTGDTLEVTAPVRVPSPRARFAVVSDIDDTIIQSHATDKLQQTRLLFSKSARSRPPLPGVVALYKALAAGAEGPDTNPFFYVSRSGWNLYDLFEEFMDRNELPRGPFYMQDLSIFEEKSQMISHAAPKLERLAILLENYPDLEFILIGDSGQHDPETYRRVVDRHPGRIKAIYIRDVTPHEDTDRDRTVQAIAREVRGKGVPMVLSRDSLAMAEHLRDELGLLSDEDVDAVREEVDREAREEGRPDDGP